jgi:hypothetical protein
MKKALNSSFALMLILGGAGMFAEAALTQEPVPPPATAIIVSVNGTSAPNTFSAFIDASPYRSLTPVRGAPFQTSSNSQPGAFATSQIAQAPGTNGSWCTYVADSLGTSDSGNTDIAVFRGTSSGTFLVENFYAAAGLSGIEDGVGLSVNGKYLYANYTGSVMIEVLQIDPSTCKLLDTGHGADASGPGLGIAVSITARGNSGCVFAANGDGSVGSFKIGGGNISSVSEIFTEGSSMYGGVPAMAAVTNDGYVLFDDALSNGTLYEAFKIGTGCTLTTANERISGPYFVTIRNSETFVLAPDGMTIYTIGQGSGTIQENFYAGSGLVDLTSCEDVAMNGFKTNFTYPGTGATPTVNGAGGGLFVAEAGGSEGSYVGAFIYFKGCLINGGQFQTNLGYTNTAQYLVTLAQPSE